MSGDAFALSRGCLACVSADTLASLISFSGSARAPWKSSAAPVLSLLCLLLGLLGPLGQLVQAFRECHHSLLLWWFGTTTGRLRTNKNVSLLTMLGPTGRHRKTIDPLLWWTGPESPDK